MALFSSGSILAKPVAEKAGSSRTTGNFRKADIAGGRYLVKTIGNISMGEYIHFHTKGAWNMHNLLFYILGITGPANLYFTTWAVSEMAVRLMFEKQKSQEILSINAILDKRVKIRRPQVLQLANQTASTIALKDCHAKVAVLENDTWGIAIVGSSNMTRNPRMEAGIICCDMAAAAFHKNWILKEINA